MTVAESTNWVLSHPAPSATLLRDERSRARVKAAPVVTDDPRVISQAVDAYLARSEPVMFDVETTGLDPRTNKLVMVQLRQPSSKSALIIDWRSYYGRKAGARYTVAGCLRRLFRDRMAVGHNIKFDSEFLLAQGVAIPKVFDTMIAEQLIAGGREMDFGLAPTLERRFGMDMSKAQREWFYKPLPLDERLDEWNAPFPGEEVDYAALDVDCLPELYEAQRSDLAKHGLREVAHIEMRALPALAAMEMRGIRINVDGWRAFITEKAEEAKRLEDEALSVLGPHIMSARIERYDKALDEWKQARADLKRFEERLREEYNNYQGNLPPWGEFKKDHVAKYRAEHVIPAKPKCTLDLPNIGSKDQLIDAMEGLGIPVPTKRNDKGQTVKTTESDALERLALTYPVLKTVLSYRAASKMVDSFGEKLLAFADTRGRIHPDYHQIGADTGRMSCSKPNWQQIPSRGDGKRLRSLVIPDDGNVLITADFSNIELRVIADLSGDEKMLEMFASGEDLHSYTARVMFNLGPEVDPKTAEWRSGTTYRQAAKIVNYLIPYGGSAFAIAMQNNLLMDEAEDLVARWFGMFPGVKAWMAGLQKEVHKTLCSRTAAGRIRRYDKPREPEPGWFKNYAEFQEGMRAYKKQWAAIERQARNTPVQGLSADITKLAIALFYESCALGIGIIVAVVHDEIVVETNPDNATLVQLILADAMEKACQTYLKRVAIPRPEPTISDHWEHD